MLEKRELKNVLVEYFTYRMHKEYWLCREATGIAVALQNYGFKPTDANIVEVAFYLQHEHLYPEVYAARLRAVQVLGDNLSTWYDYLKTDEYQNKTAIDQPLEDFELEDFEL